MFFKTKSNLLMLLGAFLMFSCAQDEQPLGSTTEPLEIQKSIIPKAEIDQLILRSIQEKGDFIWMEQSVELLYSALIHGDSILTVGYQPAELKQANARIGIEDIQGSAWKVASQKVLSLINETLQERGGKNYRIGDQPALVHEALPYLEVKIDDFEVLRRLNELPEVRYFEPVGYPFDYELLNATVADARIQSDSGCYNEPQSNLPVSDYSVITPNAKASWNYPLMGISQAWSQSTGAGITVGVIDTGISPNQPMLGNAFNSGASSNRFVQRFGTFKTGFWLWKSYDGPDDRCGHGTAMSGVVASPRNAVGNTVGVAYNANLISVRATSDVIINTSDEKNGVAEALVLLGNRSDVRIISMSIGDVFSNSKVADAVRYAYNRGKLIFAAAGTSTTFTNWVGVIFPANMNETVAVTGIKEGNGYERCDTCHSGSKVEFTVIMERAGSNTKPLSVAQSGDQPSTVGGSSVATATASGIAALVWSVNPTWSRDQVLSRLRQTSALYPNRNSQYGFGNLNAAAAVSGIY